MELERLKGGVPVWARKLWWLGIIKIHASGTTGPSGLAKTPTVHRRSINNAECSIDCFGKRKLRRGWGCTVTFVLCACAHSNFITGGRARETSRSYHEPSCALARTGFPEPRREVFDRGMGEVNLSSFHRSQLLFTCLVCVCVFVHCVCVFVVSIQNAVTRLFQLRRYPELAVELPQLNENLKWVNYHVYP